MRNDLKYKLLNVLLIIFILTASGCGLAPKEEAVTDAPLIPTGSIQQYRKVEVIRGDIIDSVTVRCTYKAFKSEELKFSVNGLAINQIYVQIGDYVKAGDLLADLEMGDYEQQISDRSGNIELLNMKINNENELKDLAVSTLDKLKKIKGFNSQIKEKYELEIENHDDAITGLTNDLYIEQERLKQLNEEVSKRQIRAGIDGIVSNIVNYDNWYVSDTKDKLVTIYDPDTFVFVTDGKHSDLFGARQEVNITVAGIDYKAVVMSSEELNDQIISDPGKGAVYLKTDDKQGQLQDKDIGEITFILNELKDVLYLPSTAVHKGNDIMYVFVEDEGGFKSMKEVETGLSLDRKVEIKSGLSEGDIVILD